MVLDYLVGKYQKESAYATLFFSAIASLVGYSQNAIAQEVHQAFRNPRAGIERVVEQNYDSNEQILKENRRRQQKYLVKGQITYLDTDSTLEGSLVTVKKTDGSIVENFRVGSDGMYEFKLKSGTYILEFSDHLTVPHIRKIKVNANTRVDVGLVPSDFPMDFYDDIARNNVGIKNEDGTARLEKSPSWYINVSPAVGSGKLPTQQEISLVESIIRTIYSRASDSQFGKDIFIGEPMITIGTNPPSSGTPPPGVFIVQWNDNYPGGRHGELIEGNTIVSGVVYYSTGLDINGQHRPLYWQELLQVLGVRNDSNRILSIFNTPALPDFDLVNTPREPTELDWLILKFLYSRPVVNQSPDNNLIIINDNKQSSNHFMNYGKMLRSNSRESKEYLKINNRNYLSHNRQQKWLRRAT